MGPSLLSFGLDTGVEGYWPEKGKFQVFLFAKESNTKRTNWDFSFLRQVNTLFPLGGRFLAVVLGGTGGVKIGTVFLKKN